MYIESPYTFSSAPHLKTIITRCCHKTAVTAASVTPSYKVLWLRRKSLALYGSFLNMIFIKDEIHITDVQSGVEPFACE